MKQLLNSSTYRRIQFVEFLDQLPSWCDVKEAARKIDCSAKTLLSDIDYINEFGGITSILNTRNFKECA